MKKPLLSALLLVLGATLFAQVENTHSTQLYFGFGSGSLLSGDQYDLLHDSLRPTPFQYSYLAPSFGLRQYILPYLGFEANADVYGNLSVTSKGTRPLECYRFSYTELGALFRHSFPLGEENSLELYGGGGANYHWFEYSSKFTSLFPSNIKFYEVKPEVGYYAKAGACYFFTGPLFFDAQWEYTVLNSQIPESGAKFSGNYLKTNLHVGLAF